MKSSNEYTINIELLGHVNIKIHDPIIDHCMYCIYQTCWVTGFRCGKHRSHGL